jgi:hypothetical protein
MSDNMAEYDSNIPDYEMMLMSLNELNRRLIEFEKQHTKDQEMIEYLTKQLLES